MKTILATTYALNPYKGSEDGMGWNFIFQIARNNKVFAVTRKNNEPHITKYISEYPCEEYNNITFLYYDLPYWMRFWKRGSRGAMLYYYLWQLFMPLFILSKKITFDISHNVNFHNDWTPSLLWTLGKPMIWGPIGHHPKIPKEYLKPCYGNKAFIKDRLTWGLKKFFWNVDPFLKLTASRASHIWAMNNSVKKIFPKQSYKIRVMPSVASENIPFERRETHRFHILSIGRLVPLKGFDITLKSFARFYYSLSKKDRQNVTLTIIGDGPERSHLIQLAKKLSINQAVDFKKWMDRSLLSDYYSFSDAFLFPSHEGAGMVVSEALSFGVPVLCFDNCGPGEFINNSCGFRVPYTTVEESIDRFADHLTQLHNDPNMKQNMSHAARYRFESNFDWNIRAEQLNEEYNEAMFQKRTSTQNSPVANTI